MEKLPLRQLIKTAIITTPLVAFTYCTPFYIFQVLPNLSFFIILPLFTIPISITWILNILFVAKIKAKWVQTLIRPLLISVLMFGISGVVIAVVHPFTKVDPFYVNMMRVVNILSVNLIVYVLVDLTITKENKNKMQLENANLKIIKLEADYKLLKDQINPHFLFNALSTVKSLIKEQPELADEYIVRLSDFLRASIKNTQKTVSIKEELELCNDFISLNKIRFGKAIQFECDIKIDPNQNFVPYFAFLTLIENAIKHNAFSIEEPLTITITFDGDKIEVRNNKKNKFVLGTSSKTGLQNLNERYKLVSGKQIEIVDTDHFYSVKLPILKTSTTS